jgi:hypothetical protein
LLAVSFADAGAEGEHPSPVLVDVSADDHLATEHFTA